MLYKDRTSSSCAQARLSLFMPKCHIVGNHMSRLICHSIRCNKDELYIFKIFLKVVHRISSNPKL